MYQVVSVMQQSQHEDGSIVFYPDKPLNYAVINEWKDGDRKYTQFLAVFTGDDAQKQANEYKQQLVYRSS